ncbi:MAG: terminase family protein [Pseudomonadota bacterium]
MVSSNAPAIPLLPYQIEAMRDRARFLCLFWARGVRKTFTATLKIVDYVFEAESQGKREPWNIISRGERQALEAMQEVKKHYRTYNVAAGEITGHDLWSESEGRHVKIYEVNTPGKSRILSLPANPDTVRGFTANIYLDEFAFHKDSQTMWKAVYPCLRGRLKMMVSSTPQGKGNRFYQIATDTTDTWSIHKTDIYEAVKQGLPFDIEMERRALNDPDAWAQEYELKWLDEASAWLSYDLISSCESDLAGDPLIYDGGTCYLGMDVARRRDFTVLWVLEERGGTLWTREVVKLRRADFRTQLDELGRLLSTYKVMRGCIDQTGLGEFLVDEAKRLYGTTRIEGVLFTGAVKQDLATQIKQKFEDRLVRIPIDRDIRDSFHAVKKTTTTAGNPRFDADRTDQGHADEFWACALAIHGATNPVTPIEFQTLGRPSPVLDAFAGQTRNSWGARFGSKSPKVGSRTGGFDL